MGELQQSPDSPVNQVHSIINGNTVPVVRTDPRAYMVNDGTYDRVMIGGFGDGTYGLKVSKPGFDVKTTGNANIIMSSAFNMFKIVGTGTLSLTHTIGGSSNVITTTSSVAHGLSYTPALLAFISLDPGIMSGDLATSTVPNPYPILYTLGGGATLTLMGQAEVYVNSTTVFFTLRTDQVGGGPYTCSAKYYLFQETFS